MVVTLCLWMGMKHHHAMWLLSLNCLTSVLKTTGNTHLLTHYTPKTLIFTNISCKVCHFMIITNSMNELYVCTVDMNTTVVFTLFKPITHETATHLAPLSHKLFHATPVLCHPIRHKSTNISFSHFTAQNVR